MEPPQEGSIAYVTQRLLRFVTLESRGFAQITFTSEFSRREVLIRLQAEGVSIQDQTVVVSKEGPAPALLIDRWHDTSDASDAHLRSLVLTALPGAEPEFTAAVSRLNLHRESIGAHPSTFALWLPPNWQRLFLESVPDFDSWTMLRLNLSAVHPSDPRSTDALPLDFLGLTQEEAEARAERLLSQSQFSTSPEVSLKYLSAAVETLIRGTSPGHAALIAQQALDQLQGFQPSHWQHFEWRAILYSALQRHAQAISDLETAIQILDGPSGEQDDTRKHKASLLLSLGRALRAVGDYEGAEIRLRESLDLRQSPLSADNLDTISVLDEIAQLWRLRGLNSDAEQLFQRALATRERILGADHPLSLASAGNLANLYVELGRFAEAEPLLSNLANRFSELFGADHPASISALNNLANLYHATGRQEDAVSAYLRVLDTRERLLGPNHPSTLQSLNNLANAYCEQGRYSEAEPLQLRASSGMELILGSDHPDTLQTLNNLAALFSLQSRYPEAESALRRVLRARQRLLGSEHPQTLATISNLGELYRLKGDYQKAEPLLVEAYASFLRQFGESHPYTQKVKKNLERALSVKNGDKIKGNN